MLRRISLFLFSLTILSISLSKAQNFEKLIDLNFKGKLKYCLSLNEAYFYIGNFDSTASKQLLLYKTDSNGNVLVKNTQINILHKAYCHTYDDSYIIVADSNRIIKIDTNLNLIWIKNIPMNSYIRKIKYTKSNHYLIDIDNQIMILDTSGNIVRPGLNYTDELSDFDIMNDTLITLSARYNNSSKKYETIITKYSNNNVKLIEKKLNPFNNSYPKILVLNNNSYQLISSDGKYFGYYVLTTFLNDSFVVTKSYSKTIYNFELTFFKYNNNSLLTYWYNDRFTINRIHQLNSELAIESGYSTSIYSFCDLFTAKDASVLAINENGFILKFKGKSLTGFNSPNKINEPFFSPNPFNEKTTLKLEKNQSCILNVFDVRGKTIINKIVEVNDDITVNSNELPSRGVYLYRLMLNNKLYTGKIVY